jgi:ankyrin repeat protein
LGLFCPVDIEIVKLLVQNGANMNLRNHTTKKQFEDVMVPLIEKGLTINRLDKAGKTASDYMEDNDGKNILKKYGAKSATELTA